MDEKRISMISGGPYGESILYTDGSTEPVPTEDVESPPLVGDINIEETRAGFEVWLSDRIVQNHESVIEDFFVWLLQQPEIVSVDDDTVGVVQVKGVLSDALRIEATAWWASRVRGLDTEG